MNTPLRDPVSVLSYMDIEPINIQDMGQRLKAFKAIRTFCGAIFGVQPNGIPTKQLVDNMVDCVKDRERGLALDKLVDSYRGADGKVDNRKLVYELRQRGADVHDEQMVMGGEDVPF
jgi:hypothetical protein